MPSGAEQTAAMSVHHRVGASTPLLDWSLAQLWAWRGLAAAAAAKRATVAVTSCSVLIPQTMDTNTMHFTTRQNVICTSQHCSVSGSKRHHNSNACTGWPRKIDIIFVRLNFAKY